jgi:hypothetical protein
LLKAIKFALHNKFRDGVKVRFIKGRLKFGGCKNAAPFPSMIVVFRGKKNNKKIP